MPRPKPSRSKPPSIRRRCVGTMRRWSSELQLALRFSVRLIARPTCWRALTPQCTRARRRGTTGVLRNLRDNIRRKLVLDEGDAIAQVQFALLQALHLNKVGAHRILERRNRGVEVAMLLLQARQLRPKLAFFLCCHRCLGRPVVGLMARSSAGKSPS